MRTLKQLIYVFRWESALDLLRMGAGDSALPAVAGVDDTTAGGQERTATDTISQQLEVAVQRWHGYTQIPALRSRNWQSRNLHSRQSTRTRMEMAVGDAPVAEIAESPVTTIAESPEGWGIVERTESSGELAKMVGSTAPTPFTPVTKIAGSLESLDALELVAGIESPAVAETDASTTETTQPQSPEGAEIDAGRGERWGNANDELKEMVVSDATLNIQSSLTTTYSSLRALADDPAMATLNVTDFHKRVREHIAKEIELETTHQVDTPTEVLGVVAEVESPEGVETVAGWSEHWGKYPPKNGCRRCPRKWLPQMSQ